MQKKKVHFCWNNHSDTIKIQRKKTAVWQMKVIRVCEMFPKPLRVIPHIASQKKLRKGPALCLICVCVCVSVTPLYLSAHTHSLLPWDKRGHTVNHCWCDDRQHTEGTMHKAANCRGWYTLAPLSLFFSHTHTHTHTGKSQAHAAFSLQHMQKSCNPSVHVSVFWPKV